MIPNSAPMAAVYLTADKRLFSRPVAVWDAREEAMVCDIRGSLVAADFVAEGNQFLGLWQHGWTPSYDEMATLLPKHTPGTPHPLATRVVVQQGDDGWWRAHLCGDDRQVTAGRHLEEVEQKLAALGTFHIDRIVALDES